MLLDDLVVYREAVAVGECVWSRVSSWDWFAKQTVGRQMVRSADSISANIAEGHGRYYFGENRAVLFSEAPQRYYPFCLSCGEPLRDEQFSNGIRYR